MPRTLLIMLALTPAALADPPFFMGMGDLPGGEYHSWAGAISGDGQVVFGHSKVGFGDQDAVRWTCSSGLASIGGINIPGAGFDSWSHGSNSDGSIAVGMSRIVLEGPIAFRWTQAGGMEGLGSLDPNVTWSFGRALTEDGSVVVGDSLTHLGIEAFRWTEQGGMTGLGDLEGGEYHSRAWAMTPDGSIVVGLVTTEEGEQAAYWTEAQGWVPIGDLPGGEFESFAWGISADGTTIVGRGSSEISRNHTEAFRWTAARGMEALGFLPGGLVSSTATAVSADGSVIVGDGSYGGRASAMIWTAQHGMRDLRIVLETEYGLDLSGWALEAATAISRDGKTIAGIGFSTRGREGWIAHLGTPCYANFHNPKPCDATLDILDYLAFQDAFVAADPRACNCDTTTGQTCDIFDYLCFQDAFAAGCQ